MDPRKPERSAGPKKNADLQPKAQKSGTVSSRHVIEAFLESQEQKDDEKHGPRIVCCECGLSKLQTKAKLCTGGCGKPICDTCVDDRMNMQLKLRWGCGGVMSSCFVCLRGYSQRT